MEGSGGSRSNIFDQVLGLFFLLMSGQANCRFGKFLLKIPNFQFFLFSSKKFHQVRSINTWVKDGLPPYLAWVKSMLCSGRVRAPLMEGERFSVLGVNTSPQSIPKLKIQARYPNQENNQY